MLKIGLTGGIGSGKTTISKIFSALNYPVFYSDTEAKKIMHSSEVRKEIEHLFGSGMYENDNLNRTKLAELIFNNEDLRRDLEGIVHPRVREAFNKFVSQASSSLVINEAAILFETGANKNFDKIIYVTAPVELRIQRVISRDHVSEELVKTRIQTQNPDEVNARLADYVIVNDGEHSVLKQIQIILEELN